VFDLIVFSHTLAAGQNVNIFSVNVSSGAEDGAIRFSILNDAGNLVLRTHVKTNGGYTESYSNDPISLSTKYEIRWNYNVEDLSYDWFIDGERQRNNADLTPPISLSGILTTPEEENRFVAIGTIANTTRVFEYFIDNIFVGALEEGIQTTTSTTTTTTTTSSSTTTTEPGETTVSTTTSTASTTSSTSSTASTASTTSSTSSTASTASTVSTASTISSTSSTASTVSTISSTSSTASTLSTTTTYDYSAINASLVFIKEAPGEAPELASFYKQPFDSYLIGVNFTNVMDTDEEDIDLSECSISCKDASGESDETVYEEGTLSIQSTTILKVRIQEGEESGSPYKFTFRMVTNSGNKWEKDVKMTVEDI